MSKRIEVIKKIIDLRNVTVASEHYETLQDRFLLIRDIRRVEIDAGIENPMDSIALIGASGGGKTACIKHLITMHQNEDTVKGTRDLVSFRTPSPATMKSVGHMLLDKLGFSLERDKPATIIWDMVRNQLREQRVLFLHFDEAQDLRGSATAFETQNVVNTLKSLMQTSGWPVGLILSGTHELKKIINSDEQLVRRVKPVEIKKLSVINDIDAVYQLILDCSAYVSLNVGQIVLNEQFQRRLMHAADYEFGLTIEITIAAIEDAMLFGATHLEAIHFVNVFRSRSGCLDVLNPFVALDYQRINVRKLLEKEECNE